jgi:hypothetical protein
LLQAAPLVPQAVAVEVPATHCPLTPSQQPPLQVCDTVQVLVHWCELPSQA